MMMKSKHHELYKAFTLLPVEALQQTAASKSLQQFIHHKVDPEVVKGYHNCQHKYIVIIWGPRYDVER
jgi:hypothetical protein